MKIIIGIILIYIILVVSSAWLMRFVWNTGYNGTCIEKEVVYVCKKEHGKCEDQLISDVSVSGSLPTDEDIKNFAADAVEPFKKRGDNMNMAETYIILGAKFVTRKITGND